VASGTARNVSRENVARIARVQFGAANALCSREYIGGDSGNAPVELRHVSSASSQADLLVIPGLAAVLAVAFLAGASPAAAHPGPWHWSEGEGVKRIVGTVIKVEGKRVRISSPVTCLGQGRRVLRRGVYRWKHFSCIQSILSPRGGGIAGPDVLFRVHVVGARRFGVTNARFAD
jgi:hypothetical protein